MACKPPKHPRFIISNNYAHLLTFKIDKYTGKVFQLVQKRNQDLTWEQILFLDSDIQDKTTPARVNFQIFVSGLGARHTYLLQINTGKTWQLIEDSETSLLFWMPFD